MSKLLLCEAEIKESNKKFQWWIKKYNESLTNNKYNDDALGHQAISYNCQILIFTIWDKKQLS